MLIAFTHRSIPVCTIGTIEISIPLIEVGAGKPLLSIVAGVHGNETTSTLIIDALLKRLPPECTGTLRVITCANPLALLGQTRQSIADFLDLNRAFPGNRTQSVTHRVGSAVLEALEGSDAVIDLHSFEMQTPLMAVQVLCEDERQNKTNKSLITAFSPDHVWVIDSRGEAERAFSGSLGSALNRLRIPNFAVELDRIETVCDKDIDRCVEGILAVFEKINGGVLGSGEGGIPFFDRTVIHCPEEGIIRPLVKPFDTVVFGQPIATVTRVGFDPIPVLSPCSGTMMQISPIQFARPGHEIAAIGLARRNNT